MREGQRQYGVSGVGGWLRGGWERTQVLNVFCGLSQHLFEVSRRMLSDRLCVCVCVSVSEGEHSYVTMNAFTFPFTCECAHIYSYLVAN